jgi:hypothetical protein
MFMLEERSIFSVDLMNLAKRWIEEESEVFVIARLSHSGGGKEYYFFNDFNLYKAAILQLPPRADVCIFRKKQLATRAIADKQLEQTIKSQWQPEEEWMITKLVYNKPLTYDIWYDDENELEESFKEFRNELVAVGHLPAWWQSDHDDMQSGLTPLNNGTLERGIY